MKFSQAEGADPVLTRAIAEDKVRWWKKPNLRYLYLFLFPTCMGIEITSGFDSQIINAVQIVDPWQEYFGEPEGALLGIIGAMYSLGAICSLPFIPVINQHLGRRWSIFLGSWVMVVGAVIQCTAQHVGMYLAARWLLGFGIPTCIISGAAMLGELGYPKERPILTSLFNASYFIGAITAAGITFGTQSLAPSDWSWRVPSLLQAVPSLIQISLIFFVPESPRWLISKDRREEAFDILVTFLVELFPFAVRTRGMAIFQFFGRGAGFFSTFVNPIGLKNATWKYLIMYCVWLAFEIVCIYFLWPETYGRTLEELTFLFEDKSLQEQQEKITMQELQKDIPDERIEVVETKA